jgi:hypothetical protein
MGYSVKIGRQRNRTMIREEIAIDAKTYVADPVSFTPALDDPGVLLRE